MDDSPLLHGWQRLSNGFDVKFRHGIPVRLSDNGQALSGSGSALREEIAALARLRVRLGEWLPGEKPGEREAGIIVSGDQFAEVLRRLALSSAAVFYDRFRKPLDREDVDWDTLEYANDFHTALECCALEWDEVDKEAFTDGYVETMHHETRRLAQLQESPIVEPE
jgi:hypothetical protein